MNTAGTQQNTAFGEDGLMILAKDVSQKDGSNGFVPYLFLLSRNGFSCWRMGYSPYVVCISSYYVQESPDNGAYMILLNSIILRYLTKPRHFVCLSSSKCWRTISTMATPAKTRWRKTDDYNTEIPHKIPGNVCPCLLLVVCTGEAWH